MSDRDAARRGPIGRFDQVSYGMRRSEYGAWCHWVAVRPLLWLLRRVTTTCDGRTQEQRELIVEIDNVLGRGEQAREDW